MTDAKQRHPRMSLAIRFIRRVELGLTGDEDDAGLLVELRGIDPTQFATQEGRVVVDGHGLVRGEGDADGLVRFHLDHPAPQGVLDVVHIIIFVLVS